MRISILLSLLFLAGWTFPAGQFADDGRRDAIPAFSIAEKNVAATPPQLVTVRTPAETTGELADGDDADSARDEATPIAEPVVVQINADFAALAALDAVADDAEIVPAVPLPPRRAIPHAVVCEALADAAANNDLPAPFLIRLIWQESGFDQNAVSHAGAQGVAQFMPETAARRGLDDPFNPLQAVRASARFLRDLIDRFGNVGLAAAAYNAGPNRVQSWLTKHGNLPKETRDYVVRITGMKPEQWTARTATPIHLRVPSRAPCQREAGLYASNGPEKIPLPPSKSEPEVAAGEPAKNAVKIAATATRTVSAKAHLLKPKQQPTTVVAAHTVKNHKKIRVADAEARK